MSCDDGKSCFTSINTPPSCDSPGNIISLLNIGAGSGDQAFGCAFLGDEKLALQNLCSLVSGPGEYNYNTSFYEPNINYYNTSYSFGLGGNGGVGFLSNCPGQGYCGVNRLQQNGCLSNCIRVAYSGDPLSCCFNDWTCNAQNQYCFSYSSTNSISATCSPDSPGSPGTRNITSSACTQTIYNYCTGQDLDPQDPSWIFRWILPDGQPIDPTVAPDVPNESPENRGCYYAYLRNLYSSDLQYCINPGSYPITDPSALPLSVNGVTNNSNLIAGVFARYQQNGFILGSSPGTQGYSVFQDFLFDTICAQNPEICASGLKTICSEYTADRLTLNPTLSNFCGCYLPDSEYNTYAELYSINKECTPMCNRSSVIPLVDGAGNIIECTQGVCLIDNITINLIDSQAANGVSFSNFCNNCSPNNRCNCTISDTTIDVVNSKIGGGVVINNGCNSTLCVEQTKNGPVSVPCYQSGSDPTEGTNNQISEDYSLLTKSTFWIILVVLILFFLLVFVLLYIIGPDFLA